MFIDKEGKLYYRFDDEQVQIEAWGENALRVRATKNRDFTGNCWALKDEDAGQGQVNIELDANANGGAYANMYDGSDHSFAEITNGKLKAVINSAGVITFSNNQGKVLLKEHFRRLQDEGSMPLNILGREFKKGHGDNFRLAARFKGVKGEKIFGMGQYQQHEMNMKGCLLELAQRNSQVSVPFYISSLNYGFMWNNPGVGQVMFAENGTEWVAESTKELDYLVIAGDSPSEIEETYAALTGYAPMMPEYGLGFWQCKLRYRTQEELLEVARKYHEIGIHLDTIVVDFFHWPEEGDFRFDEKYWPDVPAMVKELDEMGTRLVVSIWPTVSNRSENYREMWEKGYLIRCEEGVHASMLMITNTMFFDATNPEAREYLWSKVKKNYWDKGARLYWLDVAEPEYTTYQFENYRYQLGTCLEVGNTYSKLYIKSFYDGMTAEGDESPILLSRSAWLGSAQYGALVWSGDIDTTFECFNRQVRAGLNMAIAGIPWWTTDIAGFHGSRGDDPAFRELYARWFAYAAFCPVMRLHGNRLPGIGFGEGIGSGSPNEIWSFGEQNFEISKKYIAIREKMRDYNRAQMKLTHEKGTPIMRPLFYDFPSDSEAWETEDAYMFGPDLLVAPVLEAGAVTREVYLPAGAVWTDVWTGTEYEGGQKVTVPAPLQTIPVFARGTADIINVFKE